MVLAYVAYIFYFQNVSFNSERQSYKFRFDASMASSGSAPFEFAQLPFDVKVQPGRQNLWVFEATIGTDFVTAGSLGMTLSDAENKTVPISKECVDSGVCVMGQRLFQNQFNIRTLLSVGSYVLRLYDLGKQRDTSLMPCSPFDLQVKVNHVDEEEDFVNCPVARLPETFNYPGYLHDGHMFFAESVFLDPGSSHSVTFTLQTESFFRAHVAEHHVCLFYIVFIYCFLFNVSVSIYFFYQLDLILFKLSFFFLISF